MQVPAAFGYERAASVEHALALLEQLGPESRLLAGGHSLLPMMKLRLADPVARNRGTIGGALCQADPAEDLSAVCAAVGARMVIRSSGGERVVAMRDFHRGPYTTAVGPAEMLVEIRVPAPERAGSAYAKVDRRVGDWAVAAAGAAVELDDGTIARAGIALAAVGGEITSAAGEEALAGRPPSGELFTRAGALAAAACSPVTDQRGSAEYKRHVVGVLVERVLARATARALQPEEG